jgi:diguanylate cyclase (GGDEF)-like protein/PAS domain S-box-containing protein
MVDDKRSPTKRIEATPASSDKPDQCARWRLEQVERIANLGAWEVDIRRRSLHVSLQWQRIHGVDQHQLSLDEAMDRLAHPDDLEAIVSALQKALAGESRYEVTHRICRGNDRAIRWVQALGEIERDPSGRPICLVGAALDVTERRWLEQTLQEQDERLRLTLEATNDGLWDIDLTTGQVTANNRFFEMLGYSPGELVTQIEPLFSAIHEDDQPRVRAKLDQHLRDGAAYSVDFRLRCKDGGWRWIHGRGKVVARDPRGQSLRMVGTNSDIHERKLAEQARDESNRRLHEAEQMAMLGHWEYDPTAQTFRWSRELYRIFGLDPSASPPNLHELRRFFHHDDTLEFSEKSRRFLETGVSDRFTLRIYRRDGALRWLFSEARAERDAAGRIVRCFGTAQDVTEWEQAQEQLRQAAKVFDSIADAVVIATPDHQIVAVNQAFSQITGYSAKAVTGKALEAVISSAQDTPFWDGLWVRVGERGRWQGERWERRQDGELYRARICVTLAEDKGGRVDRYIIVIGDITRLRRTQEQLDFVTNFDALTGLANRKRFRARLEQALQTSEYQSDRIAVLLLDLDRFRVVNESLGPAGADQVLKTIGNALVSVLGPAHTVGRLDGDEFGIILSAISSSDEISDIAERLLQTCSEPRIFNGQRLSVTASVGVAVYPLDGFSADALLRHADVALKRAKERGRKSLEYFEFHLMQDPKDRLHFEACLSQALLKDELHLHYQPQVDLASGQLVGAEGLLRWTSPELGHVGPERFIPIAEDMGLIVEIGSRALDLAARQLATWDRHGMRLPHIAINLSVMQLEHIGLVDEIETILQKHAVDPARLELEITESLMMRQAAQPMTTLKALRDLGVKLVVDDFGTGYSSLSLLHRLPLHQVKIDKSFIFPLPNDTQSQAVTKTIIALGKNLGLEVLAEGVETAEQAAWLNSVGCPLAQGYHYDRPLAPEAFARRWL